MMIFCDLYESYMTHLSLSSVFMVYFNQKRNKHATIDLYVREISSVLV